MNSSEMEFKAVGGDGLQFATAIPCVVVSKSSRGLFKAASVRMHLYASVKVLSARTHPKTSTKSRIMESQSARIRGRAGI